MTPATSLKLSRRHATPGLPAFTGTSRLARLEAWLPLVFSGLAFVFGVTVMALAAFAELDRGTPGEAFGWVLTAAISLYVLSLAGGVISLVRMLIRGRWSAIWMTPAVVIMMSPILLALMHPVRYS